MRKRGFIEKLKDRVWGEDDSPRNEKRRAVLKTIGLGAGAFAAYKAIDALGGFISEHGVLSEHIFENFRVVETGDSLTFFDRQTNDAILIIDKH